MSAATLVLADRLQLEPDRLLRMAGRLAAALVDHPDDEYGLALVKRVARELGEFDDGYPLFLKLLLVLAESSDVTPKQVMARVLALAMRRSDLPSGPLTSWGASSLWSGGTAPVRAGALLQRLSSQPAPKRQFGPIEYLTTWHVQRTHRSRLGDAAYADGLAKLVALVDHSAEARRLYPNKLIADANNEMEGVYTRVARERLESLGRAWLKPDATVESVVTSVVPELGGLDVPKGWYLRDL